MKNQQNGSQRRPRRIRFAPLLLGALGGVVGTLLVAGVVYWVFYRDTIPALTAQRLEAARSLWEKNGPADYDMTIVVGNGTATYDVQVRGGNVTDAKLNGNPIPRRGWDDWSVDGLFAIIERELEMADDPAASFHVAPQAEVVVQAEFSESLGYPLRFHRAVLDSRRTHQAARWETSKFESVATDPQEKK